MNIPHDEKGKFTQQDNGQGIKNNGRSYSVYVLLLLQYEILEKLVT